MQEVYFNFTHGVAAGRNMSVEAVDKIGKGRVWTGAQAKDLGLVDELGGLDRAIGVAKQLAHIPADRSVRIVRFPEEKTFFQVLLEKQMGAQSLELGNLDALLRKVSILNEPVQARVPFLELRIR
jgi:protease IV